MVRQQNSFSRVMANTAKMGAYYTDLSHCRDIAKMFRFPKGKEVSVIEPSIGDASAVIACTGADRNENIKIFGVELNDVVSRKTKENPYVEECLSADFISGVFISNNVFSFCFGNPPYLEDDLDNPGARDERVFLEKVTNYLSRDGIIVWVIPYAQYVEPSFVRYWLGHYDELAVYRFRPEEYAKWHQVVLIGRKAKGTFVLKPAVDAFFESHKLENIKELPSSFSEEEMIDVPESPSSLVKSFATKVFDFESAYNSIAAGHVLTDINRIADEAMTVPRYVIGELGQPPTELKKDSKYLLATSGAGQGLTGTDGVDLHLQRGVAEVIEEVNLKDGTTTDEAVVTTRTSITMTVVENDGTITVLS